jgi:hypothetical protein
MRHDRLHREASRPANGSLSVSLYYVTCPRQRRRRHGQAEGFRGLEVDDQFYLGGLLDGQILSSAWRSQSSIGMGRKKGGARCRRRCRAQCDLVQGLALLCQRRRVRRLPKSRDRHRGSLRLRRLVPAQWVGRVIGIPDRHQMPPPVARRHWEVLRRAAAPVRDVERLRRPPIRAAEDPQPGTAWAQPRGHRSSRRGSGAVGWPASSQMGGVIQGQEIWLDAAESRG